MLSLKVVRCIFICILIEFPILNLTWGIRQYIPFPFDEDFIKNLLFFCLGRDGYQINRHIHIYTYTHTHMHIYLCFFSCRSNLLPQKNWFLHFYLTLLTTLTKSYKNVQNFIKGKNTNWTVVQDVIKNKSPLLPQWNFFPSLEFIHIQLQNRYNFNCPSLSLVLT